MLEEQVEIVHRLLDRNEESVTFLGSHYRLEACQAVPKPVQDPHPPLLLGGEAGPRATRLAARWADEYNVLFATPGKCKEARARLDAACVQGGRDPSTLPMSLMTGAVVGADAGDIARQMRRIMDLQGESGDPAAYGEHLGARGWVIGTPDQVIEDLAVLGAAGVRRVMLAHLLHDDLENLELIGRDVLPLAASL